MSRLSLRKNNQFRTFVYIGDDVQTRRNLLDITYPIERGVVKDWDSMEAIWEEIVFHKNQHVKEKSPILVTDSLNNPKINREKAAEIMLEKMDAPSMYVGLQPVLSLWANGLTTGVVTLEV